MKLQKQHRNELINGLLPIFTTPINHEKSLKRIIRSAKDKKQMNEYILNYMAQNSTPESIESNLKRIGEI